MASPLRQELWAGTLHIWSCSYESRRSWTNLWQLVRIHCGEFSSGASWNPTAIQGGILSPNLNLSLMRKGEIGLLLQGTFADTATPGISLHPEEWRSIRRTTSCLILHLKEQLLGSPSRETGPLRLPNCSPLFLVFSWDICTILSLLMQDISLQNEGPDDERYVHPQADLENLSPG